MAKDDVKPRVTPALLVSRYNAHFMRPQVRESFGRSRRFRLVSLATLLMTCGGAAAGQPAPSRTASPSPLAGGVSKPSTRRARAPLRWPLEIRGAILSTFGEYRYDH